MNGEEQHPMKGERHAPTARELEVLTLIASGKSTKETAHLLGIAFKTAASHRSRVMAKLNANNTADLTRAAIRMGLIEP
jgi:DNA-binding NarL/FixJ family response regulator